MLTRNAYKECIETLSRWYAEGLIWNEYYTANQETFNAKLNNTETCMFGASLYPYVINTTLSYYEDLAFVAPPAVPGRQAELYVNCGLYGYKNTFTLTNKCERPDIVLAWLDRFYSLEGSLGCIYNLPTDEIARYTIEEDGTVTMNDLSYLSDEEQQKLGEDNPSMASMMGHYLWLKAKEDYDSGLWMSGAVHQALKHAYDVVDAPYLNAEIWPRPYYTEEATEEIGILRTDIFSIVTEKEANWITGASDINADREDFKAQMEAVSVPRYVELLQEAYNAWLDGRAMYQ